LAVSKAKIKKDIEEAYKRTGPHPWNTSDFKNLGPIMTHEEAVAFREKIHGTCDKYGVPLVKN
jgi:hypothetical protein